MYLEKLPFGTSPSEEGGEFYTNTYWPEYLFHPSGIIFSTYTNNFLSPQLGHRGYLRVGLININGETEYHKLHRVIAYVFHPLPSGVSTWSSIYVNHIDGNKLNNSVLNLEWVTHSQNVKHASENGLHPKKLPVTIYNIGTNEVTYYNNRMDAARAMGLTKDQMEFRLRSGENVITPEGYLVRYTYNGDPNRPWMLPEDLQETYWHNRMVKPWLLKNIVTGEVVRYEKQDLLAEFLGTGPGGFSTHVRKIAQPLFARGNNIYQVKQDIDSLPWRYIPDVYLELYRNTSNAPVFVWNTIANTYTIYLTPTLAANDNNLKLTTLSERLRCRRTRAYPDGKIYLRYIDAVEFNMVPNKLTSDGWV